MLHRWRDAFRAEGLVVKHKKVLRLMRQDNLLAVCQRRFVLTTDAGYFLPVYAHLAALPRVVGVDQLRPSDITYIRLRETFVYLAVVLDAHSRRVIGWRHGGPRRGGCIIPARACRTLHAMMSNSLRSTAR